jgi:hypothetical protein
VPAAQTRFYLVWMVAQKGEAERSLVLYSQKSEVISRAGFFNHRLFCFD